MNKNTDNITINVRFNVQDLKENQTYSFLLNPNTENDVLFDITLRVEEIDRIVSGLTGLKEWINKKENKE